MLAQQASNAAASSASTAAGSSLQPAASAAADGALVTGAASAAPADSISSSGNGKDGGGTFSAASDRLAHGTGAAPPATGSSGNGVPPRPKVPGTSKGAAAAGGSSGATATATLTDDTASADLEAPQVTAADMQQLPGVMDALQVMRRHCSTSVTDASVSPRQLSPSLSRLRTCHCSQNMMQTHLSPKTACTISAATQRACVRLSH